MLVECIPFMTPNLSNEGGSVRRTGIGPAVSYSKHYIIIMFAANNYYFKIFEKM